MKKCYRNNMNWCPSFPGYGWFLSTETLLSFVSCFLFVVFSTFNINSIQHIVTTTSSFLHLLTCSSPQLGQRCQSSVGWCVWGVVQHRLPASGCSSARWEDPGQQTECWAAAAQAENRWRPQYSRPTVGHANRVSAHTHCSVLFLVRMRLHTVAPTKEKLAL